jgi:hypothetical protein
MTDAALHNRISCFEVNLGGVENERDASEHDQRQVEQRDFAAEA